MTDTIKKGSSTRFCIAVILCFASAYLSEITLGAAATIPFILILSAAAYFVYAKPLRIAALTALSAFIVKCVYSADTKTVLIFMAMCAVLSFISAQTARFIYETFVLHKAKKAKAIVFALLFVVSFVFYIMIYGTIFGNLSSKSVNRAYIENTYTQDDLRIGSTYYSFSDKRYVTQFSFTARERYSALVSADSETEAPIDGYRDLKKNEIMNVVLADIRSALSTFAYEGEDFAIRNGSYDPSLAVDGDISFGMTFEIGLRYKFRDGAAFEKMCKSYIDHLKLYDNVGFGKLIFYGFDESDSDKFAYTLEYAYGSADIKSKPFDDKSFDKYFDEKDTHKYWELLG